MCEGELIECNICGEEVDASDIETCIKCDEYCCDHCCNLIGHVVICDECNKPPVAEPEKPKSKRLYRRRHLSGRYVVVAAINEDIGDWAAYIHTNMDSPEVARMGDKISKTLALFLFPDLEGNYVWRY